MIRVIEPELMTDIEQCLEFYKFVPDIVFHEKLKLIPKDISGTVGELGCGPGVFTAMLRDRCPNITIDAYDGSEIMLDIAKTHIKNPERITFINQLIENIDKKYDIILSHNTLHHIHDPLIFWKTVKRMSKKDSKILVTDLMRPNSEEEIENIIKYILGDFSENSLFKKDFVNSLKAAFTKEEVEEQTKDLNCSVSITHHLGITSLIIKNF